jgi:hypothetical protein
MISRRNFIKFLTVGILSFSFLGSVAQASYKKSVTFINDFGGVISKPISGYIDDVTVAQNIIREKGYIHPRGTGHSSMGQSMREGAFIYTPTSASISIENDIVNAPADMTLLEIDNYLMAYGRMLPVSPDHRNLSLGGVLSVGGFDFGSFKNGSLASNVHSLSILEKDGVVHNDVSVKEKKAYRILGGAGQYGIILSAKVKTVLRPSNTLVKKISFSSSRDYVDHVKKFIEENNFRQTDKEDNLDVWCGVWHEDKGSLFYGQHIYKGTVVNTSMTKDSQKINDLRAIQKKKQIIGFLSNHINIAFGRIIPSIFITLKSRLIKLLY